MYPISWSSEAIEPMSFVAVPTEGNGELPYPEHYRDQILIDVIHDGHIIPDAFLRDQLGRPIDPDQLEKAYVLERDWGARLVAKHLAKRLALPGFYNINIARCLVDFGRFPGVTGRDASHLRRFAINHPFSDFLGFEQKMGLLEDVYDRISDCFDQAVPGRLIKIAVHTYDSHNASGTVRPQVSLVSRALGYQVNSEMPTGFFDPLYPDILAEFTADRMLRDRISLHLHKSGIPVAHNYPYLLPEGSPEVRAQVWSFFNHLKQHFQEANPRTREQSEFQLVWQMLMDTNLRNSESETLRSFLHMFRRAPRGRARLFGRAEKAYRRIESFLHEQNDALVSLYQFDEARPSALGIEVRKDLVMHFDDDGRPVAEREGQAERIAGIIGDAILVYLNEDRDNHDDHTDEFSQVDPWFRPGDSVVPHS